MLTVPFSTRCQPYASHMMALNCQKRSLRTFRSAGSRANIPTPGLLSIMRASIAQRYGGCPKAMASTRRLAAILAAGAAGNSRLMGADEEGTLQRLKAQRR